MNSKKHRQGKQRRLLLPLLLFLFSLAALFQIPKENYYFPRPLNYKSYYENFYNPDLPYVTVTVPELASTGLQYRVNGLARGSFYYTLHDGFCQFYLLRMEEASSGSILESMELKGRLIRLEDAEYDQILSRIAGELNWDKASLQKMTAPYAVSTLPYPVLFSQFFRLLIYGCLILSLTDLLQFLKKSGNTV